MIFTHAPLLRRRYVHVPSPKSTSAQPAAVTAGKESPITVPLANVRAFEDHFTIYLALPGYTKEEVTIAFEQNTLIVSGRRKTDISSTYNKQEFSNHRIRRSFVLPNTRGNYAFSAEMKDGILAIVVTKPEEAKSVQIPVI